MRETYTLVPCDEAENGIVEAIKKAWESRAFAESDYAGKATTIINALSDWREGHVDF